MQVWLQLQDLHLLGGSHGLTCLHDVFQHITTPASWGPLRFGRICVAFSPLWSHGREASLHALYAVLSYSNGSYITGRWAFVET